MLNLDPAKLLVIFVLALIVMGPERLPTFAKQLGRAWKTVAGFKEQAEEEIRKAMPDFELPKIPKNPSAMVTGFLTDLVSPTNTNSAVSPPEINQETGAVEKIPYRDSSLPLASPKSSSRLTYLADESSNKDPQFTDPSMN